LPPVLFDFGQLGQLNNSASLVFDHIDYRLFLPFTTSTTYTVFPDLYTPSQLLGNLQTFFTSSLSGWNISASITPDYKLQFLLGGVPPSSPQLYVSRTIYAPLIPDLPPPLNLNPLYLDRYNLTSWGFNSITLQIPRTGGIIGGRQRLNRVTNLQAPQNLYAPYQYITSGSVNSTFFSLVPHEASWVEGCLAVQPNFQLGIQRNVTLGTGGLLNLRAPDSIWTPVSLCALILIGILTLGSRSSIYTKLFALFSIVLGVVSLTRQRSESSEVATSPGIWNQQGRLIYTPIVSGTQMSQKLIALLEKN